MYNVTVCYEIRGFDSEEEASVIAGIIWGHVNNTCSVNDFSLGMSGTEISVWKNNNDYSYCINDIYDSCAYCNSSGYGVHAIDTRIIYWNRMYGKKLFKFV